MTHIVNSGFVIFFLLTNGLALCGVVYAFVRIRRARAAERAWVIAVRARRETLALLQDLGDEAMTLSRQSALSDGLRQMYLEEAVSNVVRDLTNRRELSPEARSGIERGLKQTSVEGRRAYATKLVQEGLSGRVLPA